MPLGWRASLSDLDNKVSKICKNQDTLLGTLLDGKGVAGDAGQVEEELDDTLALVDPLLVHLGEELLAAAGSAEDLEVLGEVLGCRGRAKDFAALLEREAGLVLGLEREAVVEVAPFVEGGLDQLGVDLAQRQDLALLGTLEDLLADLDGGVPGIRAEEQALHGLVEAGQAVEVLLGQQGQERDRLAVGHVGAHVDEPVEWQSLLSSVLQRVLQTNVSFLARSCCRTNFYLEADVAVEGKVVLEQGRRLLLEDRVQPLETPVEQVDGADGGKAEGEGALGDAALLLEHEAALLEVVLEVPELGPVDLARGELDLEALEVVERALDETRGTLGARVGRDQGRLGRCRVDKAREERDHAGPVGPLDDRLLNVVQPVLGKLDKPVGDGAGAAQGNDLGLGRAEKTVHVLRQGIAVEEALVGLTDCMFLFFLRTRTRKHVWQVPFSKSCSATQ